MSIFTKPNMILVFSNVIFFIIVQTLFFNFVASKQFNVVLRDKADILNQYISQDKDAQKKYKEYRESKEVSSINKLSSKQEKNRKKENRSLIGSWIGIPLLLSTAILMFLIIGILLDKNSNWDKVDTVLLTLIVGAYATELLFYLGIVSQYEFYGDQQIFHKIYSEVNNNVNKEPVTEAGKKYKKYLDIIVNTTYRNGGNVNDVRKKYKKHKHQVPELDENIVLTYANLVKNSADSFINFDDIKLKAYNPQTM